MDGRIPILSRLLILTLLFVFSVNIYSDTNYNPGDVVLDSTMGSGTTGVAALNSNRNFIGIELDNDYFETASKRIYEHQKNKLDFIQ